MITLALSFLQIVWYVLSYLCVFDLNHSSVHLLGKYAVKLYSNLSPPSHPSAILDNIHWTQTALFCVSCATQIRCFRSNKSVCTIVMREWQLYPRGPWVIRGSDGSCNKKYILINCGWVVGGWDKSLVMQIFSKIWKCFKLIFSSGRQTHFEEKAVVNPKNWQCEHSLRVKVWTICFGLACI